MTLKKYKTVLHGHKAVLLDDNMGGEYPLLWKALVNDEWYNLRTDRDFLQYGKPVIVEVCEPRTIWVNEYSDGFPQVYYDSKTQADLAAKPDRIACHAFQMVVK
jgi:hypothetical protein